MAGSGNSNDVARRFIKYQIESKQLSLRSFSHVLIEMATAMSQFWSDFDELSLCLT